MGADRSLCAHRHHGPANVIFNDLHGAAVAKRVHESVVNGENEILHFMIIFKPYDFQQLFSLFQRNMPRMVFGAVVI